MIIVEGADNTGKSTLVRQLLEMDSHLHVLHRERFKKGAQETIGTSYIRALIPRDGDRLNHGYAVADRLLASECIYGELFRGGCRMTPAEHMAVRNLLTSYGALVVHCDPPDAEVERTWDAREQMWDGALRLTDAYRERIREIFPCNVVVRYDWTSLDAAGIRWGIINNHINRQNALTRALTWWSAFPYGAGDLLNPKLVVVGESLGPGSVTPVPFASGPAGDFLAWTLDRVWERTASSVRSHVYITNASKGTDRDAALLREELGFLIRPGHTVVVTLGREAERLYSYVGPTLLESPLRYRALPHSQYWRRFHWKNREHYPGFFIEALGLKERDRG